MPTVLGIDQFRHGQFYVPGGAGYDSLSDVPKLELGAMPIGEPAAVLFEHPYTGNVKYLSHQIASPPTIGWQGFWWRGNTGETPPSSTLISQMWSTGFGFAAKLAWGAAAPNDLSLTTSDQGVQSVLIALDRWHWIEMIYDVSSTTNVCYWRVDGTDQTPSTKVGSSASGVQYSQVGYGGNVCKYRFARHMWGYTPSVSDWYGQPVTSRYSLEVLKDSPWLYWPMDSDPVGIGGSPNQAWDTSGYGRPGQYNSGPLTSQDHVITGGKSTFFDATDDYLISRGSTVDTGIFNFSQATVEVWFDYDGVAPSAGNGWCVAGCAKGDNTNVNDKDIFINENNKAVFYAFDGVERQAIGATTLTAGLYHLVGTYDGTNLNIYVNGVLDGTQAATSTYTAYDDNNVIVGGKFGVLSSAPVLTGQRKAGRRDEFAIYTTALSLARIKEHYAAGKWGYPH